MNVLCPSYEAPLAPFKNMHQVKSSLCLPLSHSSEFLQNPSFQFFSDAFVPILFGKYPYFENTFKVHKQLILTRTGPVKY